MRSAPFLLVALLAVAACTSAPPKPEWSRARAAATGSDRPIERSSGELVHYDALESRVYKVTLRPKNGGPAIEDELVFASGRFESTACTPHGFAKSPYATRMVAGGIAFDVDCDSRVAGRNVWHGVVRDDQVSGTMTHFSKDGGAMEVSTFTGELVR